MKRALVLVGLALLIAAPVPARQLSVKFVDHVMEAPPVPIQVSVLMYNASYVNLNLESHRLFGTGPYLLGDDQSVNMMGVGGAVLEATVSMDKFQTTPMPGDILQTISYWIVGGRVHMSFDSCRYPFAGVKPVNLGLNDSLVIPRPQVRRALDGTNTIRWFSTGEPYELIPGDRPEVPGAIVRWNVYRVTSAGYKLVGSVPDSPLMQIKDKPPAGALINYGIVPVFRGTFGAGIAPDGLELKRWLDGRWIPLVTVNQ